jgi:hypothetical protein
VLCIRGRGYSPSSRLWGAGDCYERRKSSALLIHYRRGMLGTGAVVSAKHRCTGGAGIFARASAPFNIKRPIFWRPLAQGALGTSMRRRARRACVGTSRKKVRLIALGPHGPVDTCVAMMLNDAVPIFNQAHVALHFRQECAEH